MGLRVNNNIAALNSYRNLQHSDKALNSSLEKLSSGYRINKAADDAAGLVISENLRSQIGGMTVAARNAQDGVNVAQTADGAMSEVTSILQRMRDLANQAASTGTNDSTATSAAQKEMTQLNKELDRIASTTAFGNSKLLDGSYGSAVSFAGGTSATAVTSSAPLYVTSATTTDTATLSNLAGLRIGGSTSSTSLAISIDPKTYSNAAAYKSALETAANAALAKQSTYNATTDGALTATVAVDGSTGAVSVTWAQAAGTPAATYAAVVPTGGSPTGLKSSGLTAGDAISATPAQTANNVIVVKGLLNAKGEKVGPDAGIQINLTSNKFYSSAADYVTDVNAQISAAIKGLDPSLAGTEVAVKNTATTGFSLSLTSSSNITLGTGTNAAGLSTTSAATAGNAGLFQVGANAGESIGIQIGSVSSQTLGTANLNLSTNASAAITAISAAINSVSDTRATLGAFQNRFEHAVNNLNVSIENITASESAIRDTDMASEMTKFTKAQILSQAGTSMLAQANSSSQNILTLLRG